jgi:hypothetical protein
LRRRSSGGCFREGERFIHGKIPSNYENSRNWTDGYKAFKVAAIGGLIFAAVMLATNLYASHHGAANGEHNWMYSFMILQGIPISLLLVWLTAFGFHGSNSQNCFYVLATIADGSAMFFFLFTCGIIWQFFIKDLLGIEKGNK